MGVVGRKHRQVMWLSLSGRLRAATDMLPRSCLSVASHGTSRQRCGSVVCPNFGRMDKTSGTVGGGLGTIDRGIISVPFRFWRKNSPGAENGGLLRLGVSFSRQRGW